MTLPPAGLSLSVIELFKQYSDNPAFKRWLSERNFGETYRPVGVGAPG